MKIAHREKVFGPGRAVPLYRNGVQAYARAWSHQHHQPGQHKGPITRAFLDVLQGLSRSGTVRLAALGGSSPSSGAGADLLGVGNVVGRVLGLEPLGIGSAIGVSRGLDPVGVGKRGRPPSGPGSSQHGQHDRRLPWLLPCRDWPRGWQLLRL
jgi:hypothetical protein